MAGIISGKMNSKQDEGMEQEPIEGVGQDGSLSHEGMEGEAPEPSESADQFTADAVRKGMKLPQGSEAAYDKIIKAGLKVMFDPSMRDETMGFIQDTDGDPSKMAEGVTAVVVSLYQQSNGTMPPNLLIPAGIELLVHATDVAKAGGMEVPKESIAEAMSQVVQQILTKFGATPEQMQKLMSGMDSGQKTPAMPSGQAGAPEQQGA